ncbi:hypothetical protein WS9_008480 [Paraclostridium sordellii 8483]|uniref:hypothetical protein n=1 Tax=Paraclostridium sordellii TaxID=1505 RepID=UPI000310BCAD|nr:hypothetical protein [Paeniclostridium sordellii]TAN67428.1 hypothetical protein WS9_008480 [Paeniclostridium sordellii 8483]
MLRTKYQKDIEKSLNYMVGNRPIEVRILGVEYKGTQVGYYDNFKKLALDLVPYIGKYNIYFTLNQINEDLTARAYNNLVRAKNTTADKDITKIKYILIDLDPNRVAGISSTDEEKEHAKKLAEKIVCFLENEGVPKPTIASSGNGYHILIDVDIENTKENVGTIKSFLSELGIEFSNDDVEVDRTTYNPARICRLYGTIACKGDNMPTRPYRQAKIISTRGEGKIVTISQIAKIVSKLQNKHNTNIQVAVKTTANKKVKNMNKKKDVAEWLEKYEIQVSHYKEEADKIIYVLKQCPWNEDHTDKSAYVIQYDNGNIVAGCHHNSCSENNWNTLRSKYEPTNEVTNENIDKTDGKNEDKKGQIDVLIDIVEDIETYRTSMDETYVTIQIRENNENVNVKSECFKKWIVSQFYNIESKIPTNDNIAKIILLLEARAMNEVNEVLVERRCSIVDNCIYYDLKDDSCNVVKISKDGWEIIKDSPVIFARTKTMYRQVIPERNGNLDILDKWFRYKDENHLILQKVILVASFIPNIARPIQVLYGEKGSSKTSTMKLVRDITDPAIVPVVSIPKTIDDLAVYISKNYVPCFDNIDTISNQVSDLLCMAVTGGGHTKRKLYTDDEEQVMFFQRFILLNGINVVATRPDLLDRSILLELERIPPNERKEEKLLREEFEKDKPMILGAIFETLSKAMSIYDKVELNNLGRMADFTRWGYAIAEVSGIGGDKFLEAYLNNQKNANIEALESHPVGFAMYKFMEHKDVWSGSPTELLSKLEIVAESEKIDTTNSTWAKTPNVLSRRLNEIKSNLLDVGIEFERSKGKNREIKITRM